ncbi:MAG: hypothetical protein PUA83_09900 [Clostridiales bacterium]|nr:hypothetical protein [Clostridiales bacterium]
MQAIFETVFDIVYLATVITLGILMIRGGRGQKQYLLFGIMAVMMGGGIWLRSSGLAPDVFIAVFYTGLGCALALAGALFWIMFFRFRKISG